VAAPAYGTSGAWGSTATTTLNLAVPASVASGDIIVAAFFIDGSTVTITGPAGFAHAPNSPRTVNAGAGGNHSVNVLWKRASAADSGTYAFTLSAGGYAEGQAHRFTTCIASGNPWDGNTASTGDGGATNSTTTPAVSFTTTGPDELFFFAGTNWSGGAWTPPTGFTEITDNAADLTSDYKVQASAGSSGTVQATCAGNDKVGAWLGALIGTTTSGSFDAQVSIARQQSSVTRIPPVVVAPTIGPPQVIRLPPIVVAPQARVPQPSTISISQPQIPAAAAGILPLVAAVVAQQFRPALVAPIVLIPPPLPQPAAPIVVASQQFRPAQVAPTSLTPPFLSPPAPPASVLVAPQQFWPQSAPPIVAIPPLLPSGLPEPSAPVWVNLSQTQPFLAAVTSLTPPPLPQAPAPVTVVPSQSQPRLAATITLTPPTLPQPAAPVVVVASTWQPRQPQIVVAAPQFPAVAPILPPAPILVAAAFVRPGFAAASVSPPQFPGPFALPPAPILVVPTFTRFRLAPVRVLAGVASSCDCTTHRPNTGITVRPGTGVTARPNTGVTARPCTC
jgi:hypothetical protein